jgi:dihydrofolate reductase
MSDAARKLALIVAVSKNGVIGRGGGLAWSWPEDRAHFERQTRGHAVIMGKRTWDETGAPLPGRRNIVVSRSVRALPGADVMPTLADALALAWAHDPEPFVIGGAALFREAMPFVTRALVTELPIEVEGDTVFHFDPTGFRLVREVTGASGARYLEYRRVQMKNHYES